MKTGRLCASRVVLGDAMWEIDVAGVKAPRMIAKDLGGFKGFEVGPARPDLYRRSANWTQYRALLNSEFGIRIAREPEEVRLSLPGHDLPVDI